MTRKIFAAARAIALSVAVSAPVVAPMTFLALPATAQAEAPTSAKSGDLAAVNRAVRAITTLTANFTQTDRSGQVQSGKLQWKQPGQIRFDYGVAGKDLLIVADGRSLYMVDYQVAQVQRWPIRNSPLGALLDPQRDISRYGKLVETADPRILSIDVRDPEHPEYGVLNLVFMRKASAPGGLELYGWVALDAQGSRTSIRLSNISYGTPIAASAFRWRDPRGAPGPR